MPGRRRSPPAASAARPCPRSGAAAASPVPGRACLRSGADVGGMLRRVCNPIEYGMLSTILHHKFTISYYKL